MKHVIISGASKGIGYYLIKELLEQEYNITVLDIELNNLLKLQGNILPLQCDIGNLENVQNCVEKSVQKFGHVDYAIHNACLCSFDSLEKTEDTIFKEIFNVNYYGALNLSRSVLKYMKEQKSGKVIFTSSGVGVMGFVNISPYASTKGAIESLAKCLNIEYGKNGISFHIFHPPLTNTESAGPLPVPKEFMADPEKVGRGLAKRIDKNAFIICHSASQKFQTMLCYLMPIKMGRLMSKLTSSYINNSETK